VQIPEASSVALYYVQVVTDTNENATETSEHVSIKPQREAAPASNAKQTPSARYSAKDFETRHSAEGFDYPGPIVEVPDLGPDDLDEHGMLKTQDKS